MDGPVAVRQLSVLDRVVSNRGEAVAARLPRQDDFASLDFLLRDHRAAGGLGSCCGTRTHTDTFKQVFLFFLQHCSVVLK